MVRLWGHLPPEDGERWGQAIRQDRTMELGVVLQLCNAYDAEKTAAGENRALTADEFIARHAPPARTVKKIVGWLERYGLKTRRDPLVIWVTGTMDQVARTLKMTFHVRQDRTRDWFRPASEPMVPGWMAAWVVGVVGLDNVARIRPSVRRPARLERLAHEGQGFFPSDIKAAYDFPANYDGSGETIGLLEFSNGFNPFDLMMFWAQFNIPFPVLTFVSVDGTPNDYGVNSWDLEATLDVQWAGALAPGARLVVYEASAGIDEGSFALSVLKTLSFAVHDHKNRPTVLSISYGDGETRFPPAVLRAWDQVAFEGAVTGITTFVASGDQGAYGLQEPGRLVPHVDAPANCPHVVAVGGTRLVLTPQGSIQEEIGWTDIDNNGASGGGISQVFPVPGYQKALRLAVKPGLHPGRGVPDVAANADPDTGYAVVFQGTATVVGGTSVASPVWAAIAAVITQRRRALGKPPRGYWNPALYRLGQSPAFHDIVRGNNSFGGVAGYDCGPGWDAVTGWGSPRVAYLMDALD